jgi:hypothetical protein
MVVPDLVRTKSTPKIVAKKNVIKQVYYTPQQKGKALPIIK